MELVNGVDAVEIDRIEKSSRKGGFVERLDSEEEQQYFREKKMAPQTIAGHFAAKEAFSKAMGTGLLGFALREVSVRHDGRGKPELHLTGAAAALAEGWRFSLSITHTQNTAIAFVTAWREGKEGAPCAL